MERITLCCFPFLSYSLFHFKCFLLYVSNRTIRLFQFCLDEKLFTFFFFGIFTNNVLRILYRLFFSCFVIARKMWILGPLKSCGPFNVQAETHNNYIITICIVFENNRKRLWKEFRVLSISGFFVLHNTVTFVIKKNVIKSEVKKPGIPDKTKEN